MSISAAQPFKGRQYAGEIILTAVRWYLRYPLAYEHVSELLKERGLAVDASCIWRWVQAYAAELNKRAGPHLKATNKGYRVNETYIKVKVQEKYLYIELWTPPGRPSISCSPPTRCGCREAILS
jgi:IS6 family transposase